MPLPARPRPAPLLIAWLLALPTLAACQEEHAAEAAPTGYALKQAEATKVRVLPALLQEMQRSLETTTPVESERFVAIVPLTTGIVTEVLAEEGDLVVAGQLLARIDQREALAQLEEARIALQEAKDSAALKGLALRDADANIEKARLSMDQAQSDYERNVKARIISALDIEKLRVAMEIAKQNHAAALLAKERAVIDERTSKTAIARGELALERAEIGVSTTEMTAPFDGIITFRGVQVGLNLRGQRAAGTGEGSAAFLLADHSDLRATIYRPQRELALFAGAMEGRPDDAASGPAAIQVTATTEALPGHTFTGRVERVAPQIDEVSPGGARLLPGMLLRLQLVTERHQDALTVPKRALRREGDTTLLFVADGDQARRVEVVEGFSGDEYVEVTTVRGELEPGMQVVVVGNRDLEDGKLIEVSGWDAASAAEAAEAEEAPAPAQASAGSDAR